VRAGTRKRDAQRLASDIAARVNAGLVASAIIAKRVTFSEFADEWLAMRMVRPTTLRRDRGLINTYLNPSFGRMLLNRITVQDILKLVWRVTQERSSGTSRRLLAVLGRILRDARKRDYIVRNPIENLDRWDKPPRNRRKLHVLNLDQLVRLLRSLPLRWAVLSLVAALTGLRWSEITGLEWSDIDFDEWRVHVRRAMPVGACVPSHPKTFASNRSVDMLWPVRLVLLTAPRCGHLVFPGLHGGLLNHGWFNRRIWRPTTRAVGIHYRFHDLRHIYLR
jgi:integrase